MSGRKLKDLVDDVAFEQLNKLLDKMGIVRESMVEGIAVANQYNNAISGAKGAEAKTAMDNAAKAIDNVSKANEKMLGLQKEIEAQTEKTVQATIAAAQKKADAEEKALNKYLVAQSKQQAVRDAADLKELAAAQKKADKLLEIEQQKQARLNEIAAKKASQDGGTFVGGSGDSREFSPAEAAAADQKANAEMKVRAAMIASAQAASDKAAAESKTIASVNASTQSLSKEEQELNQNIRANAALKAELAQVQSQMKQITSTTEQANNAKVNLTRQEGILKAAIASSSSTISQQQKELAATATSGDALNAKLARLRQTYNDLTKEERANAEVGGVLLKEINALDAETKQIAESQGLYNKSVGDYENKIKSAISAYVPYGAQLVQAADLLKKTTSATDESGFSLKKLGVGFAGFSTGVFVTAIATAIYYMSQFREGSAKIQEGLGILKQQALEIGALVTGKKSLSDFSLGDAAKTGIDIEALKIKAKYENEVTESIVKQMQAQADQDRAEAKNVELSKEQRADKLRNAISTEDQIIQRLKDNADLQVKLALDVAERTGKLNPATRKNLEFGNNGLGDISEANYLANQGKINEEGFEMYKAALDKRTEAMQAATMKEIRQENDLARLQLKIDKQLNTDELELIKARLQGEKENAKLILDDKNQSYEARYAALKVYIQRERDLIETERQIANRAPGISGTKVKANNQIAKNQDTQVDLDDRNYRKMLQTDELSDLQKQYETELKLAKDHDKNDTEELNESAAKRVQAITDNAEAAEAAYAIQYAKGEISEREYQKNILEIVHQSTQDRISEQIKAAQKIIDAKKANGLDASGDQKDLDKLNREASADNLKYELANYKSIAEAKKAAASLEIELADKTVNVAKKAADDIFKAQEERIVKQGELLQRQSQAEVDAVNRGVGTEKQKADKIAIINAQAQAQQATIKAKENAIKRKEAEVDKAFAISSIIINTEVAASKVGAQTGIFGIPLEALIIAQGALQIATVAAQPLPQFYTGTNNSPEGYAWVGERGTEIKIDPSGEYSFTPGVPTIDYLKQGTKIIPHQEVLNMIKDPEKMISTNNSGQMELKAILEELKKSNNGTQSKGKTVTNVATPGGIKSIVQDGASKTEYLKRNGIRG